MRLTKRLDTRTVVLGGMIVAALAATLSAERADAAVPSPVGYELQMSPYARVLNAIGTPDFMNVLWEESCDNPHLRVRARNKPAIMLTSDLTSVAPLTSFSLTINEGPYLFGTGDFVTDNFDNFIRQTIYTDAGVTITGSSVSNGGKTLNVNFDGLTAGKKVIFNIDLDAEDMNMFPFPDYRNILFGAPTVTAGPTTDPASYSATFTSASAAPNTQTLGGDFDVMTEAPDYMNENIRPYRSMDKVEVIGVDELIPEPSSAALAAMAMASLVAASRRRRAV